MNSFTKSNINGYYYICIYSFRPENHSAYNWYVQIAKYVYIMYYKLIILRWYIWRKAVW